MNRNKISTLTLIFLVLFLGQAAAAPVRIISLAPNLTEILFALGLGDNIVGVTDFCDCPEAAKAKTKVGGMSNPSLEAVVRLKPDIVIMTTDGNQKDFESRLRSMNVKTYVFTARRLVDLSNEIRKLGAALDIKTTADQFASNYEQALEKMRSKHSSTKGNKKEVLFIVWPDPLIAAGPRTVINDAIKIIGAENIAGDSKTSYPKYSIEEVLRRSPDLIIIGRGMDSKDVKKFSEKMLNRLKHLPAVKNNMVYYVSDDLYRLGPRTIRGIEEISALIDNKR